MKFTWTSFKRAQAPKTVGRLLELNLPLLGIEAVVAKVDTGAFSGALHATRIREVKSNGNQVLRFQPLGSRDHTLEVDSYHKRRVKSSNGVSSVRYAIDTEIEIQGQVYPITITLANRAQMKHQMLIGRSFLRLHGFLVDVNQETK
jgi:hypothetical protein